VFTDVLCMLLAEAQLVCCSGGADMRSLLRLCTNYPPEICHLAAPCFCISGASNDTSRSTHARALRSCGFICTTKSRRATSCSMLRSLCRVWNSRAQWIRRLHHNAAVASTLLLTLCSGSTASSPHTLLQAVQPLAFHTDSHRARSVSDERNCK
jgi:hypothetical protein